MALRRIRSKWGRKKSTTKEAEPCCSNLTGFQVCCCLPSRWRTRDVAQAQIEGDIISFSSNCSEYLSLTAIWVDGPPILQKGEHMWSIKFPVLDLNSWPRVGISSEKRLKTNHDTTGLFYGQHLSNGRRLVLSDWGPAIESNCTIRMLVSFTERPRLKIYYWINNFPLGLAFDCPAASSFRSGFYPAVQFDEYGGTAGPFIKEEITNKIPNERLEGDWLNTAIRLEGDEKNFRNEKFEATLSLIAIPEKINQYEVDFVVRNVFRFSVERTEVSWVILAGSLKKCTDVPMDDDWRVFEKRMTDFLMKNNPDSVVMKRGGNQLQISAGRSEAVFQRWDDRPGPFIGPLE